MAKNFSLSALSVLYPDKKRLFTQSNYYKIFHYMADILIWCHWLHCFPHWLVENRVSSSAPLWSTVGRADLCCWLESVESFGRLAYLRVRRRQEPSVRIKADISPRERAARQRGPLYKLTMAARALFIFIVPSRCQPQRSVCPLWHPMAPLYKRGAGGVQGGAAAAWD